jgi:putative acetyltransferase
MVEIKEVSSRKEIQEARKLLKEYADWLDLELCYIDIDKEVAEFPGEYGPPTGRFFLAFEGGKLAGSVAVRRWHGDICEMKRLFVRPAFRGLGIGKKLAEFIIGEAKRMGYKVMRLDTLPYMVEAKALYKAVGFKQVRKYRDSPTNDAEYFELQFG